MAGSGRTVLLCRPEIRAGHVIKTGYGRFIGKENVRCVGFNFRHIASDIPDLHGIPFLLTVVSGIG
jgi:hypothetical protein